MKAIDLARALHSSRCVSHGMGTCSGEPHVRSSWLKHAKTILAADDPAYAAHDVLCDAEYDPTFPNGCGVDRERHIEHVRAWLSHLEVTAA